MFIDFLQGYVGNELDDAWIKENRVAVSRCKQVLSDLKVGANADFAMMSVAMREIRSLRPL